jgi:hypothetical protein
MRNLAAPTVDRTSPVAFAGGPGQALVLGRLYVLAGYSSVLAPLLTPSRPRAARW